MCCTASCRVLGRGPGMVLEEPRQAGCLAGESRPLQCVYVQGLGVGRRDVRRGGGLRAQAATTGPRRSHGSKQRVAARCQQCRHLLARDAQLRARLFGATGQHRQRAGPEGRDACRARAGGRPAGSGAASWTCATAGSGQRGWRLPVQSTSRPWQLAGPKPTACPNHACLPVLTSRAPVMAPPNPA